jgi:hypothetical protein
MASAMERGLGRQQQQEVASSRKSLGSEQTGNELEEEEPQESEQEPEPDQESEPRQGSEQEQDQDQDQEQEREREREREQRRLQQYRRYTRYRYLPQATSADAAASVPGPIWCTNLPRHHLSSMCLRDSFMPREPRRTTMYGTFFTGPSTRRGDLEAGNHHHGQDPDRCHGVNRLVLVIERAHHCFYLCFTDLSFGDVVVLILIAVASVAMPMLVWRLWHISGSGLGRD